MRGIPDKIEKTTGTTRSIPACAGDPRLPASPMINIWVYPRVCGGSPSYNAAGHAPKVIARIAGARPGRRRPACPDAAIAPDWWQTPASRRLNNDTRRLASSGGRGFPPRAQRGQEGRPAALFDCAAGVRTCPRRLRFVPGCGCGCGGGAGRRALLGLGCCCDPASGWCWRT